MEIFRGFPSEGIAPGRLPPATQDVHSATRTSPPDAAVPSQPRTTTPLLPRAHVTPTSTRRSVADIFAGKPPVTQGSAYCGPITNNDDAPPWPSQHDRPTRRLTATRPEPRFVPSEAGGLADACAHAGCGGEVWACCVTRGCARPLCALHIDHSRCHEHGATLSTCPCPPCRAGFRDTMPRAPPLAHSHQTEETPRQPARGAKRLNETDRHRGVTVRPRTSIPDGACLIRALRALGPPVPLVGSGPFWALADGNAILAVFHMHLAPFREHPLPPGGSRSDATTHVMAYRRSPLRAGLCWVVQLYANRPGRPHALRGIGLPA